MKKIKFLPLSLISAFLLTSCGFIYLPIEGNPILPDSESEIESEDNPQDEEKVIKNIQIMDNKIYDIGDIYNEDKIIEYLVEYTDGTTSNKLPEDATIRSYDVYDQNDQVVDTSKPFNKAMVCHSRWTVLYDGLVYGPSTGEYNITFEVRSGFDHKTASIESVSLIDKTIIKKDESYENLFKYEIEITWSGLGNEIITLDMNSLATYNCSISLKKSGGTDVNVVASSLLPNQYYTPTLIITKEGQSPYSYTLPTFRVNDGSYLLQSTSITSKDIDISLLDNEIHLEYAHSQGDLNILVVPINLYSITETSKLDTWTQDKIDTIESYFFDNEDNSLTSLKEYFEVASYGNLTINGVVAPLYNESEIPTELAKVKTKIPQLQNMEVPLILYQIFAGALNHAFESLDISWDNFDMNSDYRFDTIHFITNYKNTEWGSTFWPQYGYKLDNVSIVRAIS